MDSLFPQLKSIEMCWVSLNVDKAASGSLKTLTDCKDVPVCIRNEGVTEKYGTVFTSLPIEASAGAILVFTFTHSIVSTLSL